MFRSANCFLAFSVTKRKFRHPTAPERAILPLHHKLKSAIHPTLLRSDQPHNVAAQERIKVHREQLQRHSVQVQLLVQELEQNGGEQLRRTNTCPNNARVKTGLGE